MGPAYSARCRRSWPARLLGGVLIGLIAGCLQGPGLDDAARYGPFFEPRNHMGDALLPGGLRRVLILPVAAGLVADPESARNLDAIVRTALQRQSRFEVIALSREECQRRFDVPELSAAGSLPPGLLEALRASQACDGVLFVDLTAYRPYPPQELGLRARLAQVEDGRWVWSFDELFSAEDPAVVNSLRRFHYRDDAHAAPPADLSPAALQSPGRFAAYAADTMFRTLPPR